MCIECVPPSHGNHGNQGTVSDMIVFFWPLGALRSQYLYSTMNIMVVTAFTPMLGMFYMGNRLYSYLWVTF